MPKLSSCVCCGSSRIIKFDGYFVPFISVRAFSINKKDTHLLHCKDCDFYCSEDRPTPEQMDLIYTGYRGEEYQKQRQSFEPEYTPEFNASLGGKLMERSRKDGIFSMVNKYCPLEAMEYILDYGGDHGQFFPEQYAQARRYVYDISDVELVDGVERLGSVNDLGKFPWSLILCCHVLEHLSYPREELRKIFDIMPVGGYLYVEVPYEDYFRSYISRNEAVPVHEHINFFNEKSLSSLFNDISIVILELKRDYATLRVLAMKIKNEDILCKYLNLNIYDLKLKVESDKHIIQSAELMNEIKKYRMEIEKYTNRYPRWMINLMACFIPKQKNRKHLREKYSR